MKFKKILQWAILLVIAAVLLFFAFKGVKWEDFVDGIRGCNFLWIILSMVVSVAVFWLRGLRWRLSMLPLDESITPMESYNGVMFAYLFNFVFPRAGELARCGVIAATGKASFQSVLGSVVLERSWDMLCYILILLSVLVCGESALRNFINNEVFEPASAALSFNVLWIVAAILVLGVAALVLILKYRNYLRRFKVAGKILDIIEGALKGFVMGFKMKHKWSFFLYTLLIWLGYWMMSYSTILAFPQVGDLGASDALFLMVVGSLGWIVPVQGGIGAYHFILSLALSTIYGIPQTSGVIFATISHESQALTMLLFGAISLVAVSLSPSYKKIKMKI
ncbi:MAG: lysylphosphatidylglycerol synthase transmembrane domain-containing protein [Bacteroidales bacterium]|nr:lysylphosphatidylglycerol synthase transmembrane domain-containing protein [Bacteroidales bacterium]MDY5824319.1 lysylphosphatidylglycerol synthase transmembrane domain-containing protein [Candidatus Coprenecus sp.]